MRHTAVVHGTGEAAGALAAALEGAGVRVYRAAGDPLDEASVQAEMDGVAAAAGGLDIAVVVPLREDVDGVRLVDATVADVVRPIVARLASAYIGARSAARLMARQGSGLVLVLDDGGGPAGAAVAALVCALDTELTSHGVRCLRARPQPTGSGVAGA
jgi:3-oxoacyl-[acyl-carrier protein] reductase